MKLTFDEIRGITYGAAEMYLEDEWIGFRRFTAAQMECYKEFRNENLCNRAEGTADIRLACTTDARVLSFDYNLINRGSNREFGYIDVLVDGVLCGHFGGEQSDISGHVSMPLNGFGFGKSKTLEIYLPWSKDAKISNLDLEEGVIFCTVKRKKVMLNYGDSITQGFDAHYPSLSYTSRLARMLDADSYNRAVGGDVFFPELLEPEEPIMPDIVTVAYGTNDWNQRNALRLASQAGDFYRRLSDKFPTATIFAITPIWRGDHKNKTKFEEPTYKVGDVIRRCCESLPNVHVIEGWNLVPHESGFMQDERLHPNDLGFAEYANNLYAKMAEILGK